MYNILSKSLKDIFSLEVIGFILKSTLILALFAGAFFYLFEQSFIFFINFYLDFIGLSTKWTSLISWSMAYTLFLMILFFLTKLNHKKMILALIKKNYPHITPLKPLFVVSLFKKITSLLRFLITLMILMPLLPLPIIGQAIMLYLLTLLAKNPLEHLGAYVIQDKKLLQAKLNKSHTIAFISLLFNAIPLINIFAPLFREILFVHYLLEPSR